MTDSSLPFLSLTKGRMHEAYGAGAPVFACALVQLCRGHVIWVREGWRLEQINPVGMAAFLDPATLILCQTKDQLEALAVAEDALRSGAAAVVVIELSKPVGLTEGRRLQLAAREGNATGLALIGAEAMGSNAAETRWQCLPVFEPDAGTTPGRQDSTLQQWDLKKNKSGTLGSWHVRWDAASRRICVVPPAGDRPGAAPAPGDRAVCADASTTKHQPDLLPERGGRAAESG
ncbi:hypothetical protein [Shimia sp. R10_1]|uniref:ImuA family protein n=1 Tax=Shimia sp. R10_1 TaxID=2821095 RepID=UPI001FFDF274|nr:hypothetical protein [Shimia sp. R10_1]